MVTVVLPVLDEAPAIPVVLGSLPAGFHALVVDNGSTDGSAEVAASLGATVVTEPRRGFGAACAAGLDAVATEVVCFMDCDGSLDAASLPAVVEPVVADRADLALGRRRPARGAWPWPARVANRIMAAEVNRRTGARLHDLGPLRAARTDELRSLAIADRRFGWPLEMVLRAGLAGWRLAEVDVPYRARIGRSKVTGSVAGSARALADSVAVLRSPAGARR